VRHPPTLDLLSFTQGPISCGKGAPPFPAGKRTVKRLKGAPPAGQDGPVRINQRPAAEVETRAARLNFHQPTLSQKTAKGLGTLADECHILRPKGCATRPPKGVPPAPRLPGLEETTLRDLRGIICVLRYEPT
jgi:hypothetical protein